MRLTVKKSDGSHECYLHTKVLGTMASAMSDVDRYDSFIIEELAEAVALYLNHRYVGHVVSSDEIHSMIEVALGETGFYDAAGALHVHRFTRQIKRSRIEVFGSSGASAGAWNKSAIAHFVLNDPDLDDELARAIAGAVEQKVLAMDCFVLTTALIRELVHAEVLALSQAWQWLSDDQHCDGFTEILNVALDTPEHPDDVMLTAQAI